MHSEPWTWKGSRGASERFPRINQSSLVVGTRPADSCCLCRWSHETDNWTNYQSWVSVSITAARNIQLLVLPMQTYIKYYPDFPIVAVDVHLHLSQSTQYLVDPLVPNLTVCEKSKINWFSNRHNCDIECVEGTIMHMDMEMGHTKENEALAWWQIFGMAAG